MSSEIYINKSIKQRLFFYPYKKQNEKSRMYSKKENWIHKWYVHFLHTPLPMEQLGGICAPFTTDFQLLAKPTRNKPGVTGWRLKPVEEGDGSPGLGGL
jgi:hypothetical protein